MGFVRQAVLLYPRVAREVDVARWFVLEHPVELDRRFVLQHVVALDPRPRASDAVEVVEVCVWPVEIAAFHRDHRLSGALVLEREDRVQVCVRRLAELAHRVLLAVGRRLPAGGLLARRGEHGLAGRTNAGPQLEAERALGDEDLETVERARAVRSGGCEQRCGGA